MEPNIRRYESEQSRVEREIANLGESDRTPADPIYHRKAYGETHQNGTLASSKRKKPGPITGFIVQFRDPQVR